MTELNTQVELLEQKNDMIDIQETRKHLIDNVKSVVEKVEIIADTVNKYKSCRADKEIDIKPSVCITAAVSSTLSEKAVSTVGKAVVAKGGLILGAGLVPEPLSPALITSGILTMGAGSYIISKSEKVGDVVYEAVITNYKNLCRQTNKKPAKDIIVISADNEYFKLNINSRELTPVPATKALDLALVNQRHEIEAIYDRFKQNVNKLSISREVMCDTRETLNFTTNTQAIKNIDEPVEKVGEARELIDLSYETINKYITEMQTVSDEINSISKRKVEYTPINYQPEGTICVGGRPSGRGSSGGGFVFILPVLAIPLSGGCSIM